MIVTEALEHAENAMVVGHSLGGLTVPLVQAHLHLYLCAYVPKPGYSLSERGPEAFGVGFADSVLRD